MLHHVCLPDCSLAGLFHPSVLAMIINHPASVSYKDRKSVSLQCGLGVAVIYAGI